MLVEMLELECTFGPSFSHSRLYKVAYNYWVQNLKDSGLNPVFFRNHSGMGPESCLGMATFFVWVVENI